MNQPIDGDENRRSSCHDMPLLMGHCVLCKQPQVDAAQNPSPATNEELAAQGDGQSGLAGRELDAAVAERVMELPLAHVSSGYGSLSMNGRGEVTHEESTCQFCGSMFTATDYLKFVRCIQAAPRYSTDIAAAMEVVEKMREKGCGVVINTPAHRYSKLWSVQFGAALQGGSSSESMPEAICRAALAAVVHNEEK